MKNNFLNHPSTKKDLILVACLMVIITIILLFSLCRIKLMNDEFVHIAGIQRGFGTEITYALEKSILDKGNSVNSKFTLTSNTTEKVSVEPFFINMTDFLKYFGDIPENGGIRIYPAYGTPMNGDSITFIIAIAGDENSNEDTIKNYIILDHDFLIPGSFLYSNAINASKVKQYFSNFHNQINILNEPQSNNEYPNSPSRYYSKRDLITFLYRNNIPYDNPGNIDTYKIKICGGIIDNATSGVIYDYFRNEVPNSSCAHGGCEIGFTALFRIYDGATYVGRAHEIGKPCPPKCGSLTWN